jgi:hypothetical protein
MKDGNTVCSRFLPPQGYLRKPVADGSFTQYLRDFPLLPDGAPVVYFDGTKKCGSPHMAVLDLSVGSRDLQQCADSVIRLRAEYLYANERYSSIAFHFTSGFLAKYSKWRQGWRVLVKGNDVSWVRNGRDSASRESFDKYLSIVFNYAGTRSLEKELLPVSDGSLCIGDVFIHGGSQGHCVIVMDIAQSSDGSKAFLLAQGFMPAQSMHILVNPATGGAWYFTGGQGVLETQDYTFEDEPRRFAD